MGTDPQKKSMWPPRPRPGCCSYKPGTAEEHQRPQRPGEAAQGLPRAFAGSMARPDFRLSAADRRNTPCCFKPLIGNVLRQPWEAESNNLGDPLRVP